LGQKIAKAYLGKPTRAWPTERKQQRNRSSLFLIDGSSGGANHRWHLAEVGADPLRRLSESCGDRAASSPLYLLRLEFFSEQWKTHNSRALAILCPSSFCADQGDQRLLHQVLGGWSWAVARCRFGLELWFWLLGIFFHCRKYLCLISVASRDFYFKMWIIFL
jgi:hypothetical protein